MIESARLSEMHKIILGILHVNIREYLLRLGPHDLNVLDRMGCTPLYYAAARADEVALKALLDAGADPDFPHIRTAARPLHVACQNANLEIVKQLLRAGKYQAKSLWKSESRPDV